MKFGIFDPQYGKPFGEMLPFAIFLHITKHQKVLDAEFLKVANRKPTLLDRHNALLDERGEFYNEFKSESKYWTVKQNDHQKILDEHSDMLHFFVGWMLHRISQNQHEHESAEKAYLHYYRVLEMCYDQRFNVFNFDMSNLFNRSAFHMFIELLHLGRIATDPYDIVATATYVLSFHHDSHDIFKAYEAKKDENYKRISRTRQGVNDRDE
jgi:Mg2+ and Co2+ transporter CorA